MTCSVCRMCCLNVAFNWAFTCIWTPLNLFQYLSWSVLIFWMFYIIILVYQDGKLCFLGVRYIRRYKQTKISIKAIIIESVGLINIYMYSGKKTNRFFIRCHTDGIVFCLWSYQFWRHEWRAYIPSQMEILCELNCN